MVDPVILAGLLYCGAGIGIALLRALAAPILNAPAARQQPLARHDYGWLAGAIAFGGVAGPVLLMLGLARTPAATASLLLTLEGAATALLAWFVFHENFDRRIALGMACHGRRRGRRVVVGHPDDRRARRPARHRRRLRGLGHRQQSHPQGFARRSLADRAAQRD